MRKIIPIILMFLYTSCATKPPQAITGNYRNYFGSRLAINPDSTFEYTWSYHMFSSWTNGKWMLNRDTLLLQMIREPDTMQAFYNDTLLLAPGAIKPYIVLNKPAFSPSGQNLQGYPDKLVLWKGDLYPVKNGMGYSDKELAPYYFKITSP